MGKRTETYGEATRIEYDTLTDGSVVHNVLFAAGRSVSETEEIRLGCTSEKHAMDVADALESACFSEVM